MSEKPLPPTDKRLRDARTEGNVARSEVLTGLAVSAAATELVFACLDPAAEQWLALHSAVFSQIESHDRMAATLGLFAQAARSIVLGLAPVVAIVAIASLAAAWTSGGLSFAPKAIRPSFKRLNAVRHFKTLFGAKNLSAVGLALLAGGLVGATAYAQLIDRLPLIDAMIAWQSFAFDRAAGLAALHSFIRMIFAALLLPALLSLIVARRHHRAGLRMSQRELKDELKQTNGDPLVRAQLRAISADAGSGGAPPSRPVRGKRALVMNPEHFAVLLDYAGDASEPPVVIGKAMDDDARHLMDSALLERMPVFCFRRLARHLYRHGELHEAIPPECFRAVAILYRIVEEIEPLDERPNAPIEIDDVAFDE
jgi:flagellar biosynthesis protein FlhB